MYEAERERRRAEWLKHGHPECPHVEYAAERSFGGVLTGYAICLTCAVRIRTLYTDGAPGGRTCVRMPVHCPLVVTHRRGSAQGTVVDLSMGGCHITSPLLVVEGEALRLSLSLPGVPQPLNVLRAVVRWRTGGGFGVHFVSIEETEFRRLQQFLS